MQTLHANREKMGGHAAGALPLTPNPIPASLPPSACRRQGSGSPLLGPPGHHTPACAQWPHDSVADDRHESMPLTECHLDLLQTPAHSPEMQGSALGVTGWRSVLHAKLQDPGKRQCVVRQMQGSNAFGPDDLEAFHAMTPNNKTSK